MRNTSDESPILITGETAHFVDKKWVMVRYGYMARRATIFDEQLIHWANERDKWLKEKGLPIPTRAPKPT